MTPRVLVLVLSDRCNADEARKPNELRIEGTALVINEDSIYLDGEMVLHRVEPHGFGDVHWELADHIAGDAPVAFKRFTHIEVLA